MGAQVDAGMDKTDLKKFLGYAKKDPVNCAVGISDGKPVIVLDRVKKPKAIEKDLSDKLPDMKVVRWGTASIDQDNPKLVVLRLNKSASGLAAKLRKPLKEAGFSQVEIRLEDGTVAEKVSDEEDEDAPPGGAPPAQAAQETAAAAAGDGAEQPAAAAPDGAGDAGAAPAQADAGDAGAAPAQADTGDLKHRLAGLLVQAKAAITADPSLKAQIGTLAAQASAALKTGDAAAAADSIGQLEYALAEAAAAGSGAAGGDADAAPAQADTGDLKRRLTDLVKQAIAAIAGDPSRKAELGALASQAQAALKTGDAAAATTAIDQLQAALDSGAAPAAPDASAVSATPGAADTPAAASDAPADLAAASARWQDMIKTMGSEIDGLKGAIRKEFAGEAADVLKDIEKNLASFDKVSTRLDTELADILQTAHAAQDGSAREQGLDKARALLSEHIKYVDSDPLLEMIDDNPFGAASGLKKKLTDSLKEMQKTLA